MKRDIAIRLDGAISGLTAQLDWLAHYVKSHSSEEEFKYFRSEIGKAMGALYYMSSRLYEEHPDIVPDELKPSE